MATFAVPPPQQRDWRVLPDAKTLNSGAKRLVVFLDYDGTLTTIVEESDAAVLAPPMRAAIARLARHAPVAVVSGRAREKIREFVAVEGLYYAGSHGFDIDRPGGLRKQVKTSAVPILRAARCQLEVWLRDVPGASVEDNVFSVSIHWRGVAELNRPRVAAAVDAVLALAPFRATLRKFAGKCVFELRPSTPRGNSLRSHRPDIRSQHRSAAWNKGEAALYLLDMVRKAEGGAHDWFDGVLPVYVGDDVTDEDAFKALAPFGGVGVLVAPADETERPARTHATHRLRDIDNVRAFLDALAARAAGWELTSDSLCARSKINVEVCTYAARAG